MSLRYLFFPKTIHLPDSKYNKNISLHLYLGQPTLIVDGLIQSGDILSHIWKVGIKKLLPKSFIPQSVLILGVGGGSNTLLVRKLYPDAEITAVDIDKAMLDIGFKYFGIDKIQNIKFVTSDAIKFVDKFTSKTYYDLVLVDCFEGKYIPHKLEDLGFIGKLKNHSRHTLINRIYWYDHYLDTMHFLCKLATKFFYVTTKTRSNIIISLV